MRSSIENLKQNLYQIALEVHSNDGDEDLAIFDRRNENGSPVSTSTPISNASIDRRSSRRFANSNSSYSLYSNVHDSTIDFETEKYKSEIDRLKDSESELKTLTMNYSAIVKEKEDLISRLNQENGALKKSLETTKEALSSSKKEISRISIDNNHSLKGNGDQSPAKIQRASALIKGRNSGNNPPNGVSSNQDIIENGSEHGMYDVISQRKEQALRVELEKEKEQMGILQQNVKEEREVNHSLREELRSLHIEKSNMSEEMGKICSELNQKHSEIKRLQLELSRLKDDEKDDSVKNLKKMISSLQTENTKLQMVNTELTATIENNRNSSSAVSASYSGKNEEAISSTVHDMESRVKNLEKDLKQACLEKDKARQELNRLKQHLIEKESEEAEKMDEDSKIIEELRYTNEQLKTQVLNLDKKLKQAITSREETVITNKQEIENSKKMIEDLNQQLSTCLSTIESKNSELLNLQTALGQYFAEIEAKEHLGRLLSSTKEELSKLSLRLKNAEQEKETAVREKEELLSKINQADKLIFDGKNRINILEEDNLKLRRALEQGMNRLNRMSIDSDYLVDRRIVIKLLVTYFQKSHSKEVLDLMVRMLGFSEEDKLRIGVAQQGGKGVVRGVLGLPGRFVGGILSGNSAATNEVSDNQSFADLWVDFLLKENEEREKQALQEAAQSKDQSPKTQIK